MSLSKQHKIKRKLVLLHIEDGTMVECQNLAAHLKTLYPSTIFMITHKKMDSISRAELKQMVKMLE